MHHRDLNLVARDLAYVYKHFRNSDDDAALAAAQARIVKARACLPFPPDGIAEGPGR